jgi:hypothetical protein
VKEGDIVRLSSEFEGDELIGKSATLVQRNRDHRRVMVRIDTFLWVWENEVEEL